MARYPLLLLLAVLAGAQAGSSAVSQRALLSDPDPESLKWVDYVNSIQSVLSGDPTVSVEVADGPTSYDKVVVITVAACNPTTVKFRCYFPRSRKARALVTFLGLAAEAQDLDGYTVSVVASFDGNTYLYDRQYVPTDQHNAKLQFNDALQGNSYYSTIVDNGRDDGKAYLTFNPSALQYRTPYTAPLGLRGMTTDAAANVFFYAFNVKTWERLGIYVRTEKCSRALGCPPPAPPAAMYGDQPWTHIANLVQTLLAADGQLISHTFVDNPGDPLSKTLRIWLYRRCVVGMEKAQALATLLGQSMEQFAQSPLFGGVKIDVRVEFLDAVYTPKRVVGSRAELVALLATAFNTNKYFFRAVDMWPPAFPGQPDLSGTKIIYMIARPIVFQFYSPLAGATPSTSSLVSMSAQEAFSSALNLQMYSQLGIVGAASDLCKPIYRCKTIY